MTDGDKCRSKEYYTIWAHKTITNCPPIGLKGCVPGCRNDSSAETLVGEGGKVEIAILRDRQSTFELRLIAKGKKRFEGFDEKIIALYARGMTVGDKKSGHGSAVSLPRFIWFC